MPLLTKFSIEIQLVNVLLNTDSDILQMVVTPSLVGKVIVHKAVLPLPISQSPQTLFGYGARNIWWKHSRVINIYFSKKDLYGSTSGKFHWARFATL